VPLSEVPDEGICRIEHASTGVLIAHVEGEYFAMEDLCSHEDARLSLGRVDGLRVTCPLHGSRFCLRTGEPLEEPADEPVRCYPVSVDGHDLVIDLG